MIILLLTGGPSSGGMIILRFPPGFISLIPSSNPERFHKPFMALLQHRIKKRKQKPFINLFAYLEQELYFLIEFLQENLVDTNCQSDDLIRCNQYSEM